MTLPVRPCTSPEVSSFLVHFLPQKAAGNSTDFCLRLDGAVTLSTALELGVFPILQGLGDMEVTQRGGSVESTRLCVALALKDILLGALL